MSSECNYKPVILVVDDEPDNLRSILSMRLDEFAQVTVCHPSDVELNDLLEAHLVLTDYRLDHWQERDRQPGIRYVQTGMSLATVLRETADKNASDGPTAVALHTAHLDDASGRIRGPHSRHVVAHLNNLEWVFEKKDTDTYEQVIQLAKAVQDLRGQWPDDVSVSEMRAQELLDMDSEAEWFARSWREIQECQPPIHELAGTDGGVVFLRWFLHKILPYPCFLWDIHWVAARLRIQVDDLRRLIATECDFAREVKRCKYTGILAGFLSERWWRSAIEDFAWQLGGASSGNQALFSENLHKSVEEDIELIGLQHPVVCLDRDFQPAEVASARDAVRLRPDHWPLSADAAWMKIADLADDPMLMAMVDPLDKYRVTPDE